MALAEDESLERGGLRVGEIASRVRWQKSQVSRTLRTLADCGMAERGADETRFVLSWRFYVLASRAGDQDLVRPALPVLRRLVGTLGERAHLSVLHGREVLTLLSDSPPRAVQAVGWVGRLVPAYCTSSGQALLLDHSHSALEALLPADVFLPLTARTALSLDALETRIAAGRERGYVVSDEEYEPGLVAVAAPIRNFQGRIVAAVNVSGPKYRFGADLEGAGRAVRGAAASLSGALGSAAGRRL